MTAICASFADFKLIKGRKVCQLVCEVPLEQADAALAALGGLPNPHAERWVGIAPLKEQPQGKPTSGSAPSPSLADAADSPAAAPLCGCYRCLVESGQRGAMGLPITHSRMVICETCGNKRCPHASDHRLPCTGSNEPGQEGSRYTKPERKWDDIPPSQQAGIACGRDDFKRWVRMQAPDERWDGESVLQREDRPYSVEEEVRWYCGVSSRTELDTNPEAAARWRDLYGMFQTDTRYGGQR